LPKGAEFASFLVESQLKAKESRKHSKNGEAWNILIN